MDPEQILEETMNQFLDSLADNQMSKSDILRAAFLSGAAITAHFIHMNDGSMICSATASEKAIVSIANKYGFKTFNL